MDLTIKDVAELLNVNESTIRRWLSEGVIPGYRIHHQYRFNRDEIEAWVMKRKEGAARNAQANFTARSNGDELKRGVGMQQFSLYRALNKGEVLLNIGGETKEEVITQTIQKMAPSLDLDPEVVIELLLDREKLMPTALANGVGIPHARDFVFNPHYDVITVTFPKEPIDYGALDGQPVHTLFFLFASEDKRHLHLLAKIAHLSSQPEMIAFLKERPEKEILLERIRQWESQIAPPPEEE